MPTLEELRAKWFLDFTGGGASFPPAARHAGTTVVDYTDGNLVTVHIDGQSYMQTWHDTIRGMIGQPMTEVYHSGWRLDEVRTLGHDQPASGALQTLIDAHNGGVGLFVLLSRQGGGIAAPWNLESLTVLQDAGVRSACLDNRFPSAGSNHQKAVVFKNPAGPLALLGSIDIASSRWDTPAHAPDDPRRSLFWPIHGKRNGPSHDTGVEVRGAAVADIERSFRERWNDSTRTLGLQPLNISQPLLSTPLAAPATLGTHSVQVLHTYGITNTFFGYSWSPAGEFTIWASYLNAIRTASTYIYIEDQYFLPFGWPVALLGAGDYRDSDIVYQLGEAIKRGVQVVVLVPDTAEDWTRRWQKYQRDIGVRYLETVAAGGYNAAGGFEIATLEVGGAPVYVHSKLLICDDEFVMIGSANVCQRSMAHDGELDIGVVDQAGTFARDLRIDLWREHLDGSVAALNDPIAAVAAFKTAVQSHVGRVRPYVAAAAGDPPLRHASVMRGVDPYAGPDR